MPQNVNPNPKEIALRFNEAVNAHDVDRLASMMTDEHVFIDTGDRALRGKQEVVEAWRGFLEAFPDYRNVFARVLTQGDTVIMIGQSVCSTNDALDGPALWTAKIDQDKIAEWRVHDDSPENRQRLGIEEQGP